jgi:hypothetical protein
MDLHHRDTEHTEVALKKRLRLGESQAKRIEHSLRYSYEAESDPTQDTLKGI